MLPRYLILSSCLTLLRQISAMRAHSLHAVTCWNMYDNFEWASLAPIYCSAPSSSWYILFITCIFSLTIIMACMKYFYDIDIRHMECIMGPGGMYTHQSHTSVWVWSVLMKLLVCTVKSSSPEYLNEHQSQYSCSNSWAWEFILRHKLSIEAMHSAQEDFSVIIINSMWSQWYAQYSYW